MTGSENEAIGDGACGRMDSRRTPTLPHRGASHRACIIIRLPPRMEKPTEVQVTIRVLGRIRLSRLVLWSTEVSQLAGRFTRR